MNRRQASITLHEEYLRRLEELLGKARGEASKISEDVGVEVGVNAAGLPSLHQFDPLHDLRGG